MTKLRRALAMVTVASVAVLGWAPGPPASAQVASAAPADALGAALRHLVHRSDGPPGAIAIVQRGNRRSVFRAGVSDVASGAPMRPDLHMRIASTAKAYSGGIALSLVDRGVMALNETVGDLLPWAPADWQRVTLAQALHHTSGLPDFSADTDFLDYLLANLQVAPPPRKLLSFVKDQDLEFDPGSAYRYSNSDNVVVGLMVKAATGDAYSRALADQVLRPLGLHDTSLPRGTEMPLPFMHGYDREDDGTTDDVSELVAAGYAWASGGVVSTPADQNRFIRGYVGRRLFGAATQRAQFDFVDGGSEPPGPGRNAAGLAIFRYRTGCGTMFGHTGNTLGYTQFIAASRDGRRSVVVSINRQTSPRQAPEVFLSSATCSGSPCARRSAARPSLRCSAGGGFGPATRWHDARGMAAHRHRSHRTPIPPRGTGGAPDRSPLRSAEAASP